MSQIMPLMQGYRIDTVDNLIYIKLSKYEYFKKYPYTYDTAVPQPWLDSFHKWCEENRPEITYHLILSTTIWSYAPNTFNQPVSCCLEVINAYNQYINE